MIKLILSVCLLHVVMGGWDDWGKKMDESDMKYTWMMMAKGEGGSDMGGNSKSEDKSKSGDSSKWGDNSKWEDKSKSGDSSKWGDNSKWDDKKMMEGNDEKEKMMMQYQYMMMMKKKEEAKKAEFAKFMKHFKEMKEKKEWEEKQKAMELFKKHMMMKEKLGQLEEIESMMKSFTEKKHKFVFHLTSNFLKLCKCSDVDAQVTRFFSMDSGRDSMDDDMVNPDAIKALQSGDNVALAGIIKKMSHKEQKAFFFRGLIKSMCAGAKTFVQFTKRFESTYMQGNGTSTTTPTS